MKSLVFGPAVWCTVIASGLWLLMLWLNGLGAPATLVIGGPAALFTVLAAIFWVDSFRYLAELAQERSRQAELTEELNKKRERRLKEEAQREYEALQTNLISQLSARSKHAVSLYTNIPKTLLRAEQQIDRAEAEFQRGAFSPFWDEVEEALRSVVQAESDLAGIRTLARDFSRIRKQFVGPPSTFPVHSAEAAGFVGALALTRTRLHQVVRASQTDPHFTNVYEQRKTQAILIEGFRTLTDAIRDLGDRIESRLDEVVQALHELETGQRQRHEELLRATDRMVANQAARIEAQWVANRVQKSTAEEARAQRLAIASTQVEMAERQLAMLDNLQRGRRPLADERGRRPV